MSSEAVVQWAAYGVFAFFMLGGAWRMPQLWRDDSPGLRSMPAAWPWGPTFWRGFVRAMPSSVLLGLCLTVAIPALAAVPERPEGAFARPLVAVAPFLGVFGLGTAVVIGTVLFNRPKFLVPPHLRDQDGAAAELWHAAVRRLRARRR